MKYLLITLTLLALPGSLLAAELRTVPESPAVVASEEFAVYIELYPDQAINAVEGTVQLPAGMHYVRTVTTGALTLWPQYPTYDSTTGALTFVGGSIVPISAPALLFQMIVRADAGMYTLPATATGYLADGSGTPVAVQAVAERVQAGTERGEQREPLSTTLAPLVAEVTQNADVYEGKWYVTFSGGDKGAGIMYYEVTEGTLPPAQANNVYVLQDQSRKSTIVVSAVYPDNTRTSVTLLPPVNTPFWIWVVLTLLVVLAIAALIIRKRKTA